MPNKIQFKRGLEANLPSLVEGEPGFTTDSKKLFVGSNTGNVQFAKQSAVDGIQQTLDNLKTVDANAEMQAARGEFPLLGNRLDDVTSQLAEKAKQSDVRLKAVKLGQTDMTDVFLQQMAGTTPINAVPADDSISLKKTVFYTNGTNLFNKNDVVLDKYIDAGTGEEGAVAGFIASGYIKVKPSTNYTAKSIRHYAFYDVNKTYISGLAFGTQQDNKTITSPSNAVYVRYSWYLLTGTTTVNTQQLNEGSNLLPYEDFKYFIDKTYVQTPDIPIDSLTFTKDSSNLFDKKLAVTDKYIDQETGVEVSSSGFISSGFIPVTASQSYVLKTVWHYAYLDANKVRISGGNVAVNSKGAFNYQTTAPANAAYIRFSWYPSFDAVTVDAQQMNQGTSLTPYEIGGKIIPRELVGISTAAVEVNLPPKIYALVGQELNIYFDNILSDKDTKFEYDVICDIGGQYENYFRVSPTSAGSYPLAIIVYKDGSEITRATSTLIVSAVNVGNGINKKILIIGDSTTDNNFLVPHLTGNFNTDVMDITSLGTMGTAPNKHEGRAGWAVDLYFGDNPSFTSPFMFSGSFNFSQYITTNGLSTPDYVFVNLGINDVFGKVEGSDLDSKITTILTRYQTMINSFKAQNPAVKVGICLTIPPNYSQDSFGLSYGSDTNRKDYKRTNFIFVKNLIKTFKNREAENIYLVPIHVNLDTRYNFGVGTAPVNARNTKTIDFPSNPNQTPGVHPAESGYWQIADSYWYFLKSFEA